LLLFKLRISQPAASALPIHAIVLRCQIRFEPAKRRYSDDEAESLLELFDTRDRWSSTLRPTLWCHTNVMAPTFVESTVVDLPVPCTFDFNVASTKYFHSLADGEAPLNLLFSGTVFVESMDAGLQVEQIPWDREASYRLPVSVWKTMMERYYPNCAWLCLRRDEFDRLRDYKVQRGIATWEQALESLLDDAECKPAAAT
jgi:hypothetical protein